MKIVSSLLAILLVIDSVAFSNQASSTSGTTQVQAQETPQAARVKAKVQQRGISRKSLVRVKLASGDEVKGYISKIEETSFTVTEKKTGHTTPIPYADVHKIRGPGLSKGDKIVLVVAGVAVLALVLLGRAFASAD